MPNTDPPPREKIVGRYEKVVRVTMGQGIDSRGRHFALNTRYDACPIGMDDSPMICSAGTCSNKACSNGRVEQIIGIFARKHPGKLVNGEWIDD